MNSLQPPLIGLPTYAADKEHKFSLPRQYGDAIRRAGGLPVLLPPGEPRMPDLLDRLDGLILTGGGDLDPDRYGGCRVKSIYDVDAERDASDLDIARRALLGRMPMLAICRGVQVANVALGGTLVEHVPDEYGGSIDHRKPPRDPTPHEVQVRPGTRLAGILGQERISAQSWHHQSIRKPGVGLVVAAEAADGVVEAVEIPDRPEFVGVQWHPELTAGEDPVQQQLFDHLVATARKSNGKVRLENVVRSLDD